MKRTGFLYDERYLLHDTGSYHPEMPARLEAILSGIRESGLLARLVRIEAREADLKWIETVHESTYINRLKEACRAGVTTFGHPDNQMCGKTFDIALLAVGGILETLRLLMTGKIDNAFCAVRPPGHHAEKGEAMGFCYFNNVAIAARYLQADWGIDRVAIIDIDVHHGNGTQNIFEDDPSVLYYSFHEHPSFSFPGTGRSFETGRADGAGFTVNRPILPGQGDAEYLRLTETDLVPAMERFRPQVVIVSTGFDAHADDLMADIQLSTNGYSALMEKIVDAANRLANGRLISVLEGGYALSRLPELASNHVSVLLDERTEPVTGAKTGMTGGSEITN